jgi:carbamoyl-phosphate synthase small subunit
VKAQLILENGMVFEGKAFGYLKETVGEVVFTTGMTGYQETLTDPSFYGQMVVMTYPLVGNYGINLEDMESGKAHVRGFIVREKCDYLYMQLN